MTDEQDDYEYRAAKRRHEQEQEARSVVAALSHYANRYDDKEGRALIVEAILAEHRTLQQGMARLIFDTLDLTYDYMKEFEVEAERFMNAPYTPKQFGSLVTALFPLPKGKDAGDGGRAVDAAVRRQATLRAIYASDTVGPYRATKWGALNAVSEWEQWSARAMQATSRNIAKTTVRQMVGALTGQQPVTDKALAILR
jgi:hypothetical protein